MTIGIDARFFGPKGKGLGRYTQKLIEELEKIDAQNNYVIFLRQENFGEYPPQNPKFRKVLADYRWYTLAEQIFLPRKIAQQKIDLMHFPHFNVPILYLGPYVVTIHDLILRHFATSHASTLSKPIYWLKHLAYRVVIWLAIKRAKKILTVSQWVKNDVAKCFKASSEKIRIIYEGAGEESFKFQVSSFNLAKYNVTKPYLLYVGNAYPHKNLERLIEAFKILVEDSKKDICLVLVGEEDYFYRRLKKAVFPILQGMGKTAQVVFTGFLSDDELAVLYQGAALYVFPSLCEGFGLPSLEAMSYGVPVAASRATCLPEILGETAVYFDPFNPQDMAEKIQRVLSDAALRQNLVARGFGQIKKYSWRKMAEETLRTYEAQKIDKA